MTSSRISGSAGLLRVGIACSESVARQYFRHDDLARLKEFAEVSMTEFDAGGDRWGVPQVSEEVEQRLCDFTSGLDALIVCHGAPRVTARVIAASPNLRVVGDIEGDRFTGRVDVAAAQAAGVMVIDTTHASSWPVAEWALALMLLGLRRHGQYRAIIEGQSMPERHDRSHAPGRELTGKTVGLVGFGHIAWRLCQLLEPFETPIMAHDPYAAREFADAFQIDFAPLDKVMGCDIVVCLAPATPATTGMIGRDQLTLLRPDAVFVNVGRGVVVDKDALVEKASRRDAWFGLDVHDPEPISTDSPLRSMPNVFLTPHIAGVTEEAQPRFFALMVDELYRWRSGVEPRAQITARVLAGRGVPFPEAESH